MKIRVTTVKYLYVKVDLPQNFLQFQYSISASTSHISYFRNLEVENHRYITIV